MLLVDYVRAELDMPMKGLGWGRHIGWTTDGEKAKACCEVGAYVETVTASTIGIVPRTDDPSRIIGYDVSFAVGREHEVAERVPTPYGEFPPGF